MTEENQVLISFVTKLPDDLRVPRTAVVSEHGLASRRPRLLSSQRDPLDRKSGCAGSFEAIWAVPDHQSPAGPRWVLMPCSRHEPAPADATAHFSLSFVLVALHSLWPWSTPQIAVNIAMIKTCMCTPHPCCCCARWCIPPARPPSLSLCYNTHYTASLPDDMQRQPTYMCAALLVLCVCASESGTLSSSYCGATSIYL